MGVASAEVKRQAAELLLSLAFNQTNKLLIGSNTRYLQILREAKEGFGSFLGREVEGILVTVGELDLFSKPDVMLPDGFAMHFFIRYPRS